MGTPIFYQTELGQISESDLIKPTLDKIFQHIGRVTFESAHAGNVLILTSYFDLGSILCVPSPVVLGVSTNLIQFICNGGIVFFAMKMSSTEEKGFFLKNDCDCESIKFCNVYVCLKQQSLDYNLGTLSLQTHYEHQQCNDPSLWENGVLDIFGHKRDIHCPVTGCMHQNIGHLTFRIPTVATLIN